MPTAITSGSSPFTISDSGFFFMGEDEVLVTTGSAIVSNANDVDLFVNGQIYSDNRGIFANSVGARTTINIGADATVVAAGDAVEIQKANSSLVNHGSLTSFGVFGVDLQGSGSSFLNYGSVRGDGGLLIIGTDQHAVNYGTISGNEGVFINNDDGTFINHGTVTAATVGNGFNANGIVVGFFTDDFTIQNFGTISGEAASIFVQDMSDFGIRADDLVIENHGTLVGDVDLAEGDDTYIAGADGIVVGQILTDAGNDTVRSGDHADDIDGGDGDDQIFARGGEDTILGGDGNDTIGGGTGDDIIDGGIGQDLITGGRGDDNLVGGGSNDTINGGRDDDFLSGGGGADVLNGGQGDDTVNGGGGADVLTGRAGEDSLNGGNGDDTLDGGRDDDVLTGGSGADVFVFSGNGGRDTITDFINGVDQIDLTDFGQFSFASLTNNFVVDLHGPNGSMIDFGNGDVLILENMTFGNLDDSDFIFF